MNAKVHVSASARLHKKNDAGQLVSMSLGDAKKAVGQGVEDAVRGTFGAYPSETEGVGQGDFVVNANNDIGDQAYKCEFEFELPAAMFPAEAGGLQHLIGVLCGDTFRAPSGGVHWEDICFTDIYLPDSFRDSYHSQFGRFSHNIKSIRSRFTLCDDRPLLAFTYKPRYGVPYGDFRKVALEVLDQGFNLVEPDTRRLTTPADIEQWAQLGRDAANVRPGETAFAPNLTLPADVAVEAARDWRKRCPDAPFVIKVDGGLEGLGTIQALRRAFPNDPPVLTCYPLLSGEFRRLPKGFLTQSLILSGADVVYPGNRPDFSGKVRVLDAAAVGSLGVSARHYSAFINERSKMPTFAGGAHAADLQAAYFLLGPNTGMFLGGAVALHDDGPRAGAKLCCKIIDAAVAQAKRRKPKALNWRLVREIENKYSGSAKTGYIPPSLFKASSNNRYPAQPFWLSPEQQDGRR